MHISKCKIKCYSAANKQKEKKSKLKNRGRDYDLTIQHE